MSGLDGKRGNPGKGYAEADAPDNFFQGIEFQAAVKPVEQRQGFFGVGAVV